VCVCKQSITLRR